MLCEKCGRKNAVFHYSQMINGQKTEMHLCQSCANEEGYGLDNMFSMNSMFEFPSFVSQGFLPGQEVKACASCGTTLDELRSSGFLGCGDCYDAFRDSVGILLNKIHGSVIHKGKIPVPLQGAIREKNELNSLKAQLKKAIEEENYELAAKLRDEIKERGKQ